MYLVFTCMPDELLPLVEFMYLVFTRNPDKLLSPMEFMYLVFTRMPGESSCFWWSLCTLYLLACQVRVSTSSGVDVPCNLLTCHAVRVTVGDKGLCCFVCATSIERESTLFFA